jgi:hypothetical protein
MTSNELAVECRAELLAHVFSVVLSWPCPVCGQPWPCQDDLAHMASEAEAAPVSTMVGDPGAAVEVVIPKDDRNDYTTNTHPDGN